MSIPQPPSTGIFSGRIGTGLVHTVTTALSLLWGIHWRRLLGHGFKTKESLRYPAMAVLSIWKP